ncbi:threonine/homoserine/homoserine lactone efflux protein [Angulomicrobium amanitiforme]|uniref:Threonine/homoserine/homoserine lactone efflux protein n=1 Tax=Ancylobacter amanitiformis TaxID=217069 RepID=A0ABU0LXN8_9HYPH|nr:threonine/homoserine/homoserine lactone efflux protein [Ancylobacter amanitiformis]
MSVVEVGVVLVACPIAFMALRLLGASYVIWLGWSCIRSPSRQEGGGAAATETAPVRGSMALWLQSFGVGIGNPIDHGMPPRNDRRSR